MGFAASRPSRSSRPTSSAGTYSQPQSNRLNDILTRQWYPGQGYQNPAYNSQFHLHAIRNIQLSNGRIYAECAIYSHTPLQIANAVKEYNENPSESVVEYRQQAVERILDLMRAYKPGYSYDEDIAVIRRYFSAFDDLFFFGSLKAYTVVEFASLPRGALGMTMPGTGQSEVLIQILDQSRQAVLGDRIPGERAIRHYLRILIHEMTHAVLFLYSCHSCYSCEEQFRSQQGCGRAGHGEAFQIAAHSIEYTLSQTVLSSLSLHVLESSYGDSGTGISWGGSVRRS